MDPIPLGTLLKEHVRIARVLRDKFPVLRHFEAYRDGGPTLTQAWMETAKDLDGNPRRFGRRVNIGCFELQDGPGLVIILK